MAEPGELDELRARLRRVEEDVVAARTLAGGADRETAELRTELREFRSEMRAGFAAVRSEVGELRTEFREYRTQNNGLLNALRDDLVDQREKMNQGFAEVRGTLDGVSAFLQVIADRLGGAEGDGRSPAT